MTTFHGVTLPNWVSWLAQDADGTWWGFEVEPNASHQGWYENEWGRYLMVCHAEANPDWETSLTRVSAN